MHIKALNLLSQFSPGIDPPPPVILQLCAMFFSDYMHLISSQAAMQFLVKRRKWRAANGRPAKTIMRFAYGYELE